MKRNVPFLAAVALAFLAAPVFAADDKTVNIRIELQMVAIPEELARPLVADLKKKDKIEAAHAKIEDLLTKGTAKLLGWPIVTTRSGQRAVVEAIREFRYATEYEPPFVAVQPDLAPRETFKVEPKVDVTQLEGVPSSFATRNIGVTMEVEPTLSADGRKIDLNLVPQHSRLKTFNKVTLEKPSTSGKVVVDQPEFETMKVTTSLTLRDGERILLGAFRTDDPPKHLELFLLKVEVIPVD